MFGWLTTHAPDDLRASYCAIFDAKVAVWKAAAAAGDEDYIEWWALYDRLVALEDSSIFDVCFQ